MLECSLAKQVGDEINGMNKQFIKWVSFRIRAREELVLIADGVAGVFL
mgnify:CR=1 FL=1